MQTFPLSPFGIKIVCEPEKQTSILDIDLVTLKRHLAESAIVLIRHHRSPSDEEFIQFGERLGEILQWEFGPILELKIATNPANHIFTNRRVELHWDGAFIEKKPHFNLFNCIKGAAENAGGETLFVDTRRVVQHQPEQTLAEWRNTTVQYSMEKKAHYGGTIQQTILDNSRYSGEEVMRYIEAYNEDYLDLNPMQVTVQEKSEQDTRVYFNEITQQLYSADFMYRHQWQSGDFLIADNSVLLHGRSRFLHKNSERLIKRINVL